MEKEFSVSMNQKSAVLIVGLLVVVFLTGPFNAQGVPISSSNLSTGPYIDEVVFHIIANQDQRILALQAGEIEMDNSFFDPVYLSTLNADPDISIHQGVRNGYNHFTFNCAKYPLNISGLRRAFAFAFNKTEISEEVLEGFAVNHDSLVPLPNGWCAEDQFDWHYYDAQPEIGNQILDDLNFTIDTETGFRLTPIGTPFNILLEYAGCGCHGYETPDAAVAALHSLHIDADVVITDFNYIISRLDNHDDFDMFFYGVNFYNNDVDWLAYEFWSDNADVECQNPSAFRNATYDSWRDQLLFGTTYEEVHEAAVEMQKILHYNVPRLVAYENVYNQAYRNDVFTGHLEGVETSIANRWTLRKIHQLNGLPGGSISIALSKEPATFNIYTTYRDNSEPILRELWPALYNFGPDMNPVGDLAESMLIETHTVNPAVPEGHTRFIIDIIRNATWSDGEPLTANDVAFSFTYAFESALYGNPAGSDIGNLVAAYAPTSYTAVIEFSTESYWHFSDFAFDYIIPEHIFNDETGIGYEGWNTWNPVFDPAEPNVNCGPFIFADYEAGEYYRIEMNPLFHYAASPYTPTTETTSGTTSGQTNQSTIQELTWSSVFSIALVSGSGMVIIFCIVIILKERH